MDKEILYKYFSRQLSVEERIKVQRWVDESDENLETFMAERAMFDSSLLLLDDDVEQKRQQRAGVVRRFFVRAMKVAAVVAITLCISHIYNKVGFDENVPMCELRVPAGQQLNITLADGSNVWLNSMTTLRYPAIFSEDERCVEIDGEGYFIVEKDAKRPFRVETHKGTIEVLGTTFNVDAYSKCNHFSTALIEGKVKIKSSGAEYYLAPDQIALSNEDGTLSIAPISDYGHFQWKDGIISVHNEPFMQIMRKFEKFYGVKIKVEKTGMENVRYSGKFYQADGVRYALKLLKYDMNFEFESDYENNIIHIK